ncbi:caspase family protein [Streptomyces sp. NPDC091292]|uniref:HD domain-containing protein n=1 Tax=Streptomyces sp. NPDC091292 TaxID=3365991 RepID=UPI0037FF3BCD
MEPVPDGPPPEGRRRALLIGVKDTPYLARHPELAARYPRLDFAECDVSLIRTALGHSDYTVDVEHEDTGGGPLAGRVSEFLASCEPGDTAFLYFSCHGETVNGRDHLVLSDSQPGRPAPDGSRGLLAKSLLRADPSGLLDALPPGVTAVVCLDTCRTTSPEPDRSPDGVWSRKHDAYWLYSCGAGQRSYADPVEGSWFARALAKALSPGSPPTTFHEVAQYTQGELLRIADQNPEVEPPGVDTVLPVPAQQEEHRDPLLCEGSRQTLDWTRTIRESGLWDHTSGTPAAHERVKDRLTELVHWIADSCVGTGGHRDDPWADALYPARVETRLTDLVTRAAPQGDERLSPAETACLLSAAIVHEGIVAIALDELRTLLPGRLDPGPRGRDEREGDHSWLVRNAARDVCRAHSLVLRALDTLRVRSLTDATTAADHWLRHRFIADWDRLWERTGDYPLVDEVINLVVRAIEAAADDPAAGPRTQETRRNIDSQVRQVLGHLTVKPGRSPRIDDPEHGDDTWTKYPPVRGNQWRGQQLAKLLWTAGLLAADPRRLSSVLVDHLGAHEPLRATDVVGALGAELDYDDTAGRARDAYGLAVRFTCPHPALHAAVEELALQADATVRQFREPAVNDALLRGLPDRVTTEQLRALPGRYKEPLERFRLAEDEIRPLLMGTQLYGDRMLAVRELYQNALDACRYRDMQRKYGGDRSSGTQGEIHLTQGSHQGRPYIECEDNGSGMTRTRLTTMFARAGKRYEQDPEFVLERRNWRRRGLVDRQMNSRFGIGVFSYFMLAEEVVVWTHAVDQNGRAGKEPPLRADIQSGSGLLQINQCRDSEVPKDGGTRVRLYLAEPREGEKRPSLVETLRSLLWVTEHPVHAVELNEDERVLREFAWKPDVLKHRDGWHGEPVPLGHDAWLVQGEGQFLLDGVAIPKGPEVYGRVINLRERHSPVPSVDRNQLLKYDKDLVLHELLEFVEDAARRMSEVSLRWLWRLAEEAPRVAVGLLKALPERTVAVLGYEEGEHWGLGRLELATVGCLPYDAQVLHSSHRTLLLGRGRRAEGALLTSWRFTRLGIQQGHEDFAPEGYPAPSGLDALLYLTGTPAGWVAVLQASAQAEVSVRKALQAIRRHAITGVVVPEVRDIRSLDGHTVDRPAADLYAAYADLAEDARSAPAGGTPPLRSQDTGWTRERTPAVHAPLPLVSALHNLTLGRAAELLGRLRVWDPALPPPPELDPALAAEKMTTGEVERLVVKKGQRAPWNSGGVWRAGAVGPVDLLSRAEPPFSLSELALRIERLAPFGLTLDAPPTPAALEAGGLTDEERVMLSADGDREAPWLEGELPVPLFLTMSQRLKARVGDLAARMNATSRITGVRAPEIPETAVAWSVPDWIPVTSSAPRQRLMPWELTGAASRRARNQDRDGLAQDLRHLDAFGVIDWRGTDADAVAAQITLPHRLLVPFPHGIPLTDDVYPQFGGDLDRDGITPAYVMLLAARDDTRLGRVVDQLAGLSTALPLTFTELPPEIRPLRPSASDLVALTSAPAGSRPIRFKSALSLSDLLEHADSTRNSLAATVTRLARFTPLGAAAPPGDFTGPDAEALEDFHPDRFDHAAFDKGLLGPGRLGALELVLVAGRFGWSLGRTYERYAPFRCLGLDVEVRAPKAEDESELVPDWRDVILLTERLTGRAPALSGQVDPDHIALCAEETDLDEDAVHDRLTRYADLFGLKLPDRPAKETDQP